MVAGGYQLKPELPFVPGLKRRASSKPPDNLAFALGTAVTGMRPGTFAEQVVVPKRPACQCRQACRWIQAAVMRLGIPDGLPGWYKATPESGEVAIIHGVGGGMGLAAVQVTTGWGRRWSQRRAVWTG